MERAPENIPATIDRRPAAVRKPFGSYFWDVFAWTGTTVAVAGVLSLSRGLPRDMNTFEFSLAIVAAAFVVTFVFAGPFWLISRLVYRKFGERANFFLEDSQDVGGLTPREARGEWKRPALRGIAYWTGIVATYTIIGLGANDTPRSVVLSGAVVAVAIGSAISFAFCWLTRNR